MSLELISYPHIPSFDENIFRVVWIKSKNQFSLSERGREKESECALVYVCVDYGIIMFYVLFL